MVVEILHDASIWIVGKEDARIFALEAKPIEFCDVGVAKVFPCFSPGYESLYVCVLGHSLEVEERPYFSEAFNPVLIAVRASPDDLHYHLWPNLSFCGLHRGSPKIPSSAIHLYFPSICQHRCQWQMHSPLGTGHTQIDPVDRLV